MSNIRRFITALARPFQRLEDAIATMILMRDVRYATGVWLTELGDFVGQPRQGIADDEIYRRYVLARILVNRSDGQPEHLYRITRTILGTTSHTLRVGNQDNGALTLTVGGVALDYETAKIVIAMLRQAVSSGVRIVLEFLVAAPAASFAFTGGGGLGLKSFDGTTGGALAAALE